MGLFLLSGRLALSDRCRMAPCLRLAQLVLWVPWDLYRSAPSGPYLRLGRWGRSGRFQMIPYLRLGRWGRSDLFQTVQYLRLAQLVLSDRCRMVQYHRLAQLAQLVLCRMVQYHRFDR